MWLLECCYHLALLLSLVLRMTWRRKRAQNVWNSEAAERERSQKRARTESHSLAPVIGNIAAGQKMRRKKKRKGQKKNKCVVLFRNSTRKQNDDSTGSNLSFSISSQQLPIESSARYLGMMLHCHGHRNSHFDFILPKVRYAVNRICRIIHPQRAASDSFCHL